MSSKNVPLYIPKELGAEIAKAAKLLDLPQSQCMRLSIQFGLPELLRRIVPKEKVRNLPKQASKAWSMKAFSKIDLDEGAVESGDLSEDIF